MIVTMEHEGQQRHFETEKRADLIAAMRYKSAHIKARAHSVLFDAVADAIQNSETVVRCKECKHWGSGIHCETERVKQCLYGSYMVGENGFCVYGEKVTE